MLSCISEQTRIGKFLTIFITSYFSWDKKKKNSARGTTELGPFQRLSSVWLKYVDLQTPRLKRHRAEINDNSSISLGWALFLNYVVRSIFSETLSAPLSGHPVLKSYPRSLSPTISILSGIMKTNFWSVWCRAEKRMAVNVLHMGMRDFFFVKRLTKYTQLLWNPDAQNHIQ